MSDDANFRGDCGRCAALCCVLPGFEAGRHFAFDKPAGCRCRHLVGTRCAEHERLGTIGMTGCAAFDCLGAGQLVTAMFAAVDLESASSRRAVERAFGLVREAQAMRFLLRRVPADSAAAALERELAAVTQDFARLAATDLRRLRRQLATLLAATRPAAPRPAANPSRRAAAGAS